MGNPKAPRVLLLSIKPKYAEKIFDGTKCVELRRQKPSIGIGDLVVVYVSSPVREIWGTFEVQNIIEMALDDLWAVVHLEAGVSKLEFDEYFLGARSGCGIYLQKVVNIPKPIALDELRNKWTGFNPPQSYMFLSPFQLGMVFA